MSNHVHHLLVPACVDSLRWMLQLTHKRYADRINERMGWKGHLWQERFYSCPVDNEYLLIAMKYIERNPVKARMVEHAADYHWSSAAAHCGVDRNELLTNSASWEREIARISDWYAWLDRPDDEELTDKLRRSTTKELPCGSEEYLDELENRLGASVRGRIRGRPRNS